MTDIRFSDKKVFQNARIGNVNGPSLPQTRYWLGIPRGRVWRKIAEKMQRIAALAGSSAHNRFATSFNSTDKYVVVNVLLPEWECVPLWESAVLKLHNSPQTRVFPREQRP